MELLGSYSNPDILSRVRQVLAGQSTDRLPDRTTRSVAQRQAQNRLDPAEVDRLVQNYRSSTKIDDLAKQFQISRTTVMKHVERAGAPRRRNLIIDRLDEARRLYDQGWSLARVGAHFGVDPGTVGYAFRKAGIARRDAQGR